MSPTILLTGGSGFLGSHVARKFVQDGYKLVLLARPSSNLARLKGLKAGVETVMAPYDRLGGILRRVRPDVVVHTGACMNAGDGASAAAELIDANVVFPGLLLAHMRDCGVGAFLNTGTSWQTTQGATFQPFNLYASTKQCIEDILAAYCPEHMQAITLRLFDTYGPADTRRKIVNLLLDAAESKMTLPLSPGAQQINLLHIDDAVDAYAGAVRLLLSDAVKGHEVYGVPGEDIGLRDLVVRLEQITGRAIPVDWGARPYRPREVMEPWTGLPRLPQWSARVGLDQGLRETADARTVQ